GAGEPGHRGPPLLDGEGHPRRRRIERRHALLNPAARGHLRAAHQLEAFPPGRLHADPHQRQLRHPVHPQDHPHAAARRAAALLEALERRIRQAEGGKGAVARRTRAAGRPPSDREISSSSASVPRTPATRRRARPADGESGPNSLRATSSCGNRSSSASGSRLARRSSSRLLCCVSSASNAATAGCEPALSKIRIEQASSPCSCSVLAHHVLTRAVFPIPIGPVTETTRTVPVSHSSSSQLSSSSRPNRSIPAPAKRVTSPEPGRSELTSRSSDPEGDMENGRLIAALSGT